MSYASSKIRRNSGEPFTGVGMAVDESPGVGGVRVLQKLVQLDHETELHLPTQDVEVLRRSGVARCSNYLLDVVVCDGRRDDLQWLNDVDSG